MTSSTRTRTNIELEDEPLETIMRRYDLKTKTEAVNMALRYTAALPMSREEAFAMYGAHAIGEIPPEEPVEH